MVESISPDTETGAAFDLAKAGYKPMPEQDERDEQEPIGSDSASLRDAAERRADPPPEPIVREYRDRDGKVASQTEAITLARASRDYAGARAIERLVAEGKTSEALAARVDALRADALSHDPEAAEFYGFELPEADQNIVEPLGDTEGAGKARGREPETVLAPELEKALRHPQVVQAIEEQLGHVEKARQDYLGGLSAATEIAKVSFLGQFPELASMAPDQLPGALEQMSREDPAKFARVQSLVTAGQQLLAQQQHEALRQVEIAQRSFQSYARSEDARFETMMKGEPRDTQRAVAVEIAASARASGIEPGELARLFNSEPLMRNAVFQRMMYDAGKYRLMMKARDAAVTKQVPPVQRPGAAKTRAEREGAELRTLSARLSSSGDIKDAVALYHARKSSRR